MTQYEVVKTKLQKSPKKWLVTGVAGFIGSKLLEQLLKLGQTVIGLDNFETDHQKNILAATSPSLDAANQVYNVALNDRTSLNELYELIETRLIELIPDLRHKEPVYRDFRTGGVRHSQADISKASKLLGYAPTLRIAQGLDESMCWYKDSLS